MPGPRKPSDSDETVIGPSKDPASSDPNATVLGPPPTAPAGGAQDRTLLNVNPDLLPGAVPSSPESRPSRSGRVPSAPESRPSRGGPVPSSPESRPSRGGPVPSSPESRPSRGGPVPSSPESRPSRAGAPRPPVDDDRTVLNVGALPAEPEARPSRSGPAPRRSSDDTAEAPQARQDQTAEVVSERPSTVGRRTIAGPPPHEKRARKLRSYLVDGFVATGIAAAFIMVGITAAQKHAANVAKHAPRPAPSATPLPPEASEEDQLKSREMMTKGDQAAAAEKLADARWYYEQAWKLNRRCEPCRSRLRHVEYAMISQIHAALLAAPKDIDAAQYDDAIRELEKVQQLARDPKSRDYQEAMRLLEIAKKRKEGT